MTRRSANPGQFVIERRFAAPVARVFAAWSTPEKKRRWHACHDDWRSTDYQLDFRVGGAELNRVETPDGTAHVMKAQFFDIVENTRIVFAYELLVGETRTSVSLVTVEFEPSNGGTKQRFTEQVVFLDGHGDLEERREGTDVGLSRLESALMD